MSSSPTFEPAAYLDRIAYRSPVSPTVETLRSLHLRAVPFENLDIHLGRPLRLDEDALVDKIVRRRRGGFCFELNGLFARLLTDFGFRVSRLAAQFPRDDGLVAPNFDHMTLLVQTADGDEPWLADVGAGRTSFSWPLRLPTTDEQPQPDGDVLCRLEPEGDGYRLFRRERDSPWEREYRFSLQPHALSDFVPGCRYHETSADSHFTQGRICSRVTPEGRITLSDLRLIITADGRRTERDLSEEEYRPVLRDQFGIELDG